MCLLGGLRLIRLRLEPSSRPAVLFFKAARIRVNTRAFTAVSIICIVTNPYCVTGFDIIQALHHTTAMISNI